MVPSVGRSAPGGALNRVVRSDLSRNISVHTGVCIVADGLENNEIVSYPRASVRGMA
jgi:hypothetical protein